MIVLPCANRASQLTFGSGVKPPCLFGSRYVSRQMNITHSSAQIGSLSKSKGNLAVACQ